MRGALFVGLRLIPPAPAFALTPASGLPSLRPITRVGVFPFASSLSFPVSASVQGLPALRMYLGFMVTLPSFTRDHRPLDERFPKAASDSARNLTLSSPSKRRAHEAEGRDWLDESGNNKTTPHEYWDARARSSHIGASFHTLAGPGLSGGSMKRQHHRVK